MSDRNLAILVRQLALHCNLAAQIQKTLGSGRDPYSSNWLERLRQIKRIREKMLAEEKKGKKDSTASFSKTALHDFTDLVLRRTPKDA